jgi:ABC-type transporter Mla maintaining outer membrane lipid asymmetry ATPase subunit MlaF/ABC-type transporter Mla maintaining outer membrane lipid asymmetry permease subunit MlaE
MLRSTLGINVETCKWDESIPTGGRVGMLFQQTTLLDSLTVAGNVCVALEHCPSHNNFKLTEEEKRSTIKRLLETVGLDYLRDGPKRPSELSGGMARRASLALQIAQEKHLIVLDEPFAGLDLITAVGVAKELERLRRDKGTALLLISHEPHVVDVVMGKATKSEALQNASDHSNRVSAEEDSHLVKTVTLQRRGSDFDSVEQSKTRKYPSTYGKDASQRFILKVWDYLLYSLPLILLTFLASGLAISMLSADILRRVDVTDTVLSIVRKEIKPVIQMFTGEEDVNPMYTMMINMKVKAMLDETIPPAKATLYALGMAKLFVLEIGPLITALLLSGRIGGSYAGEVATMQSTSQNKLLTTLGISPIVWTLLPSLAASWIASPLLTMAGTILALEIGAYVGPWYGIGIMSDYRTDVWNAITVPLRLRGVTSWSENEGWEHGGKTIMESVYSLLDLRCTFSDSYVDAMIEISTHPIIFHLIKSIVFMSIIMGVAEISARHDPNLTPRGVPKVITTSVVMGSLFIIFSDWAFSQLLLKRR